MKAIDPRAGFVGCALLLVLLVLHDQGSAALASAACLERANFELISCLGPPSGWLIAGLEAIALALAMLLGALLAAPHRRVS